MYSNRIVKLFFLLLMISTLTVYAQTNNEIFKKMVGAEIIMDTVITAKVLLDEPGKKFTVDTDGDGHIDTIYMIDNDDRHNDKRSPLLVKIVDEDGDMYITGEGDMDSDLYVADWYGDGTIDRVIDYIDHDNDNDLDEQVMYQNSQKKFLSNRTPKKYNDTAYFAVWARDYGDDNRLWFDANYEYDQTLTQWLTDFNGDEMFVYLFAYDFLWAIPHLWR